MMTSCAKVAEAASEMVATTKSRARVVFFM
jgi:hypothetical protein